MRLLFYLPVITQAWLENIVTPMIAAAARDAEVHVIVPPLWQGTGVNRETFDRAAAGSRAVWHWFDDPAHPRTRTSAATVPSLLHLVAAIGPDYTICRSADVEAPSVFPGSTAFLMEGDYPPFARGRLVRLTGPQHILDHGVMPELTPDQHQMLRHAVTGFQEALSSRKRHAVEARARFLDAHGLPGDRPIIGVPLEHAGADNFFMLHSPAPNNVTFVRTIAAGLDGRCVLALTVHPAQRCDPVAMAMLEPLLSDKIRILSEDPDGDPTPRLAHACDAMIFRDSKSIAWAALYGKPVHRLSRFATGDWLRPSATLTGLNLAVRDGTSASPDPYDAVTWLGYHLANSAFDPADPALDLADLLDRIDRPFNPKRWQRALDRRNVDLAEATASLAAMDV